MSGGRESALIKAAFPEFRSMMYLSTPGRPDGRVGSVQSIRFALYGPNTYSLLPWETEVGPDHFHMVNALCIMPYTKERKERIGSRRKEC
jgi:hypothetical protein